MAPKWLARLHEPIQICNRHHSSTHTHKHTHTPYALYYYALTCELLSLRNFAIKSLNLRAHRLHAAHINLPATPTTTSITEEKKVHPSQIKLIKKCCCSYVLFSTFISFISADKSNTKSFFLWYSYISVSIWVRDFEFLFLGVYFLFFGFCIWAICVR